MQPTPVFLPGESHGQTRLAGYSSWGHKRVGHDLATEQQTKVQGHVIMNFQGLPHPLLLSFLLSLIQLFIQGVNSSLQKALPDPHPISTAVTCLFTT